MEKTKKTVGKKAEEKKGADKKPTLKATKSLAVMPKKNPYHEMMITEEKIKCERRVETRNVKTDFSFNPQHSTSSSVIPRSIRDF